MNNESQHNDKASSPQRPLQYIAFWQFLAFLMLICFVWANEILDFAALIYGGHPGQIDIIGTSLLTAGLIVVGFVVIAHTYSQQKRILHGIITICSYCHKVRIDDRAWQKVDRFLADKTKAEFTHGVCPECYKRMVTDKNKAVDR